MVKDTEDFLSCRYGLFFTLPVSIIFNIVIVVLIITKRLGNHLGIWISCSLWILHILVGISMFFVQSNIGLNYLEMNGPSVYSIFWVSLYNIRHGHLLALTYQRYCVCKYPFIHTSILTDSKRRKLMAVVWIVPVILAVFSQMAGYWDHRYDFTRVVTNTSFFTTLTIIAFAYYQIIQSVRKSRRQVDLNNCTSILNHRQMLERRLRWSCFLIICSYFICNMPMNVMFLKGANILKSPCTSKDGLASSISITVASLSLMCDPIWYHFSCTNGCNFKTRRIKTEQNEVKRTSKVPGNTEEVTRPSHIFHGTDAGQKMQKTETEIFTIETCL